MSRHLSRRGIIGLATTCAAGMVLTIMSHVATAALSAEQQRNHAAIADLRRQIAAAGDALSAEQPAVARDAALAAWLAQRSMSRRLADLTANLPNDGCAEVIRITQPEVGDDRAGACIVRTRCADIDSFATHRDNRVGADLTPACARPYAFRLSAICLSGGFGWSNDWSPVAVFETDERLDSDPSNSLAAVMP